MIAYIHYYLKRDEYFKVLKPQLKDKQMRISTQKRISSKQALKLLKRSIWKTIKKGV